MFFKKSTFSAEDEAYIVVGLGNPGSEYENTRHNAGFMALDALAEKYKIKVDRLKFKSLCGRGTIEGKRVLLMKPSTYMNLSGQAVTEAMAFYKTSPENTLILFDDISLDTGRLRIRRKGSDGGHNGMKNIIYLSGSDQFPRVRLGVGAKPAQWNLADWVLSHFSKEEIQNMEQSCAAAVEAVPLILTGNIDKAMNKFN